MNLDITCLQPFPPSLHESQLAVCLILQHEYIKRVDSCLSNYPTYKLSRDDATRVWQSTLSRLIYKIPNTSNIELVEKIRTLAKSALNTLEQALIKQQNRPVFEMCAAVARAKNAAHALQTRLDKNTAEEKPLREHLEKISTKLVKLKEQRDRAINQLKKKNPESFATEAALLEAKLKQVERIYAQHQEKIELFRSFHAPKKFTAFRSLHQVFLCANEQAVFKIESAFYELRAHEVANWLHAPLSIPPSVSKNLNGILYDCFHEYVTNPIGLVQTYVPRSISPLIFSESSAARHMHTLLDRADTQKKALMQAFIAGWDMHYNNMLLTPKITPEYLQLETLSWEFKNDADQWQKIPQFTDLVRWSIKGGVTTETFVRNQPGSERKIGDDPLLLQVLETKWQFECVDNEYSLGGYRGLHKGPLNYFAYFKGKVQLPIRSFFLSLKICTEPLEASVQDWILDLKRRRPFIENAAFTGHHALWRHFSESTKTQLRAHFKVQDSRKVDDLPACLLQQILNDLAQHKVVAALQPEKATYEKLLTNLLFPLMEYGEAVAFLERIDKTVECVEESFGRGEPPPTVHAIYHRIYPYVKPIVELLATTQVRGTDQFLDLVLSPSIIHLFQEVFVHWMSSNPTESAPMRIVEAPLAALQSAYKKLEPFLANNAFPYSEWGDAQAKNFENAYQAIYEYMKLGLNGVPQMGDADYLACWKAAYECKKDMTSSEITQAHHTQIVKHLHIDIAKMAQQLKPVYAQVLEGALRLPYFNQFFNDTLRSSQAYKEKHEQLCLDIYRESCYFYQDGEAVSYSGVSIESILVQAKKYDLIQAQDKVLFQKIQEHIAELRSKK